MASSYVAEAEVRRYRGKPTVFIDGAPTALPTYSPVSWRGDILRKAVPWFFPHGMGAYMLGIPQVKNAAAWGDSPFFEGDTVTATPTAEFAVDMDAQAAFILDGDPGAYLIIRNGPTHTPSWRRLHEDQLFVTEAGERIDHPSLASDLYWDVFAAGLQAMVQYCESRPWGGRIIAYWFGFDGEGTWPPLFGGWLFDHGPAMTAKWREFLTHRYGSDAALRAAYGDESLSLATIAVPNDKLRGTVEEVSALRYWQAGRENAPLRDYMLLQQALLGAGAKKVFRAQRAATDRKRIFLSDTFKQPMMGWSNYGFFDANFPWPLAFPEVMAGSGSIGVADLISEPGCDGLVTPIDYQVRGAGGTTEPEGAADSTVLRGKYFMAELDLRTYHDDREHTAYGTARDAKEFDAISWRSTAAALTRGFNGYWMDIAGGYFFSNAEIQQTIGRSVAALKRSVEWEHADVPGIAMVLDDAGALDTNGAGNYFNEAVMWEEKLGISRCGVPYRIYLLEDLLLDRFPDHRVCYFPTLFRVTEAKLAVLREKVFRDGRVVLWGPGSGISDGETISPAHAARLTGFTFDMLDINFTRRVHIQRFDHPITAGLPADVIYGSPLSYGPVLYPTDGVSLGLAWTKLGKTYSGLSVKEMDGWTSVFTTAVPLPADLWRGLARAAGAHVYCESNDILLADSSVVALHSIQSGEKTIHLPGTYDVEDIVSGKLMARGVERIQFTLDAPETRVFRLIR
ncbi:MAG TPA: hypothetical protein PK794_04235 [Armatimonadota bacterium]|nr:hypothetical protein [Armatimonadota bacterium]